MVELMEKTIIASYPHLRLELPEGSYSLVYLDKGLAVLDLNGRLCHVSGPTFLCVARGDHPHLLYSYQVEAYTFSFEKSLLSQMDAAAEEAFSHLFDDRDELYTASSPFSWRAVSSCRTRPNGWLPRFRGTRPPWRTW